MRNYDFSPLWRSTVGFDRLFDIINKEIPNVQDTYPPYDIVRTGEESFRISLAVAGFTPERPMVRGMHRATLARAREEYFGNGARGGPAGV